MLIAFAAGACPSLWLRRVAAVGPVGVAALVTAAVAAQPRTAEADVFDYYPPYVQAVDEAAERHGVRCGLGGYWEAKVITLFSKKGVLVRQVLEDPNSPTRMRGFHWLSNARWYWDSPEGASGPVRYEFVVVRLKPKTTFGPTADDLRQIYGEPVEFIGLPERGTAMLVCNRPSDDRFHQFHQTDVTVQSLHWKMDPDAKSRTTGRVRYFADKFAGRQERLIDRCCVEDAAEGALVGPLAWGPYLKGLPAGQYRATFRLVLTRTGMEPGAVDVYATRPEDGESRLLASRPIPGSSGDVDLSLQFELPDELSSWQVEFRTHYAGTGRLALRWVDLERLPAGARAAGPEDLQVTNPSLAVSVLRAVPTVVRFPGVSFQPGTAGSEARVADASEGAKAGPLAWGPFLAGLPAGRYRVAFRTTSTGTASSNGHVDVYLAGSAGADTIYVSRELPLGHDGLTAIEFDLPASATQGPLELRTHFTGQGRLVLQWVDLERLDR